MNDFKKNVPGWTATPDDYRLIFKEVNGFWVEITNNLEQYAGTTLAMYLHKMELAFPEGTTFCRVKRGDEHIEFRDLGSYVQIDYVKITQDK